MIIIICTISCILLISCKSSAIFSSSDILIINKGGNVLLIGFAFADGMPDLLMFIVINAVSIACTVFRYLIKNTISVSTSIMEHLHNSILAYEGHIGEYDRQDLPVLSITYVFQKFLFISYIIFLGLKNCNVLCINHMCRYIL